MSTATQGEEQVEYKIDFPQSLYNNRKDYDRTKKDIMEYIQTSGIFNKNQYYTTNPRGPGPIYFYPDESNKYYLLSYLQLLKVKYIHYGIFYFVPKPKPEVNPEKKSDTNKNRGGVNTA